MKTKIYNKQNLFTLIVAIFFLIPSYLLANKSDKTIKEPEKQNWDKREHHYKFNDTFSEFEIKSKGIIKATDDDKSIESITPGGYLKISKSSFGNKRAIIIESNSEGKLIKEYYEGKKKLPFDPDGKEWLSDILLEVIRTTGISSKERVKRIYAKKGLNGVLDEISEMENYRYNYRSITFVLFYYSSTEYSGVNVRNLYFKTLLDETKLNKDELRKVIGKISSIRSNSTRGTLLRNIIFNYSLDKDLMNELLETTATLDYNTERGSVLRAFQKKYKINSINSYEYFNVIDGISINTEKGNVLKPLLKNQKLDDETLIRLFKSIERFTSNSEKGGVLFATIPQILDNKKIIKTFMDVTNGLNSSRYILLLKSEIFMDSFQEHQEKYKIKKNEQVLIGLLNEAKNYDYNTSKITLLRKVNKVLINDSVVLIKYFDVIKSMDNKILAYNVLLDLLDKHKLNNEGYKYLFESVINIARSDYKHAAGAVLRASINQLPDDEEVTERFFYALEKVGYNSTIEEVSRLLCEKENLSKKTIIKIMESTEEIDVDIEVASVLLNVKKIMPKDDSEILYVYKTIAKNIKSDYEYEKVMKDL
ncbi:MAG: hypothetical protein KAT68_13505 [Bacteroidales bacterium]|nr:hypothetical protein [Bacteroidales bacterium]